MPTPLAHVPWRLADHVRACRIDGQVILLDLKQNKYLAVRGLHNHSLEQRIEGWPADARAQSLITFVEGDPRIAPLLRQGLLTREPASNAPLDQLAEPIASLTDVFGRDMARGWSRPPRLLWSAAVTALWLRTRTLAEIAADLSARRASRPLGNCPAAIERAVALYFEFRPFLFTAHGRCLRDSLALAHFLAGEGLSHALVLGVKTRPFAAHAWVQSDVVVLNDLHENVRRYRPILIV